MNRQPDVELVLRDYFADDGSSAPDHVLDDVAERIARQPQRLAWRLRRRPIMNTYAKLAAGLAAVVIVAFVALRLVPGGSNSGGTTTAIPTVTPTAFGGTVRWGDTGAVPVTTEVDAVANGATVTGTAVSTFPQGVHTVRLGCVARKGDSWAVAGTVEKSTLPGESPGFWSVVTVKNGSPEQIAMWLSGDRADGDCPGFLASFGFDQLGPENFAPVQSGALVPPPDPAP